jgi:hypothetical protein
MKNFLQKLLIGDIKKRENVKSYVVRKRIKNLHAIWNNTHNDDSGIEKLLRLFLALTQFIFPGIYIKDAFKKYGIVLQELVTEGFVLFKVFFPLFVLYAGYSNNIIMVGILLWLMLETLFYIPTLIFASDTFESPRSFRRSMILLFLNYLEVIFCFAVLYYRGQYFNVPLTDKFDAIYFSFITSNTIGYGDFYPVVKMGKILVTVQSMFYLSFIILFINFFSHRAKGKGYFDERD